MLNAGTVKNMAKDLRELCQSWIVKHHVLVGEPGQRVIVGKLKVRVSVSSNVNCSYIVFEHQEPKSL